MAASAGAYRIFRYAELGSTNDQARKLVTAADVPANFIVVTHNQTSGRGRAGRSWQSLPGNLFCSFALTPAVPPIRMSELSFVIAVSLQEAMASVLSEETEAKIKWPNDILINGAKISGILLEVVNDPAHRIPTVVVGVGVNVVSRPQSLDRPSTCLLDLGYRGSAESFFGLLAEMFFSYVTVWEQGGFTPIRQAWLDHAVGLGEEIVIRSGNDQQVGVFEALDETGALLLRLPEGSLRTITAGDVFLG
jgi:BirA family transcriptional regulator, biotin operon repressor / biotin---[acetyl-CoA-carboxylase] ligase